MHPSVYAILAVAVLWIVAIYLSVKTSLIKDSSSLDNKPYSFSRTQLLWWTLIITSCYIFCFDKTCELPQLNDTVLALLGIGLGTTASARIVDNTQQSDVNVTRDQDVTPSQNFFTDILSDENGISVHRFQAVVFNLIYGVSFFWTFIKTLKSDTDGTECTFPTFGTDDLLLLGISSAAYVALKMNENKAVNTPPTPPATQNVTATPPTPPVSPAPTVNPETDSTEATN